MTHSCVTYTSAVFTCQCLEYRERTKHTVELSSCQHNRKKRLRRSCARSGARFCRLNSGDRRCLQRVLKVLNAKDLVCPAAFVLSAIYGGSAGVVILSQNMYTVKFSLLIALFFA